jgi:hypothetical protein
VARGDIKQHMLANKTDTYKATSRGQGRHVSEGKRPERTRISCGWVFKLRSSNAVVSTASTPDPQPLTGLSFTGTARTAKGRRTGRHSEGGGKAKGRKGGGEGRVGPIMEADVG